jgi:hypothetical protein
MLRADSEWATRTPLELAETPTLTSLPIVTRLPKRLETSGPSSTRSENPGTFAASNTAPALASTSPGVPILIA